jgi:uncharacterized repeat protein (TIGR03803 family)
MLTKFLIRTFIPVLAFAAVGTTMPAAAAPRYKVLHAFGSGRDGAGLYGGLVLDQHGNVYGDTSGGGNYGYGTVFQLSLGTNGGWREKVLRSFRNNDPRGDDFNGTPALDGDGNLYVAASSGGGAAKNGTIFELMPDSRGWELKVLHRFKAGGGEDADGGVVMDKAGNLYGAAFKLSPGDNGWKLAALHKFPSYQGDGVDAYAVPIFDVTGKLYGTTQHGGRSSRCDGGCGTVYQLTPEQDGKWKETILHSFSAHRDGAFPGLGALAIDTAGNLYGTTTSGTIFELTPGSDGHWKFTVLYIIPGGANGEEPGAGVVLDKAGNLYGTTISGGSPDCDCGVVYKLAPNSDGKWTYTVLHTFIGSDGAQPDANLILDDKGNLYGTTATGGAGGYGVAFELTP